MDGDADDDEDKREAYDEEINDMVEEDMTNDPVWSPLNGDDDCDDENALDRTAVDDGWLNPAGISHLW